MEHEEAINHKRVVRIAREHECTVAQVNAALDAHPINGPERDKYLRRLLALELVELDGLQETFRQKALDGDAVSGALTVKILERREVLLGLSAPTGHSVTIHSTPLEKKQNSTERIYSVISRIAALPPDERDPEPSMNGEDHAG